MTLNHIRPWRNIYRRKSRQIMVGSVPVGGDAPISVQTMTNTLTTDVAATTEQIQAVSDAGADIVRVSVPDESSTKALKKIVDESPIPIVADIHFHYKRAIEAAEAGAACLRINPGNIGKQERVREVVKAAKDHVDRMLLACDRDVPKDNWLIGDKPSCADIMFMSCLQVVKLYKLDIKSDKINAYYERVVTRKQYIKAMEESYGQPTLEKYILANQTK